MGVGGGRGGLRPSPALLLPDVRGWGGRGRRDTIVTMGGLLYMLSTLNPPLLGADSIRFRKGWERSTGDEWMDGYVARGV